MKRFLIRLRDAIGRRVWRLAYAQIGPHPVVDDIRIALRRPWAEHVITSVTMVDEGHVVLYPVDPRAARHLSRRWVFDDAFLVQLKDVSVMSDSGLAVHNGEELVFTTSVGSTKNAFGYKRAIRRLHRWRRGKKQHQIEEAIAVSNTWNWFHFAFEDLPGVLDAMARGLQPTILTSPSKLVSIGQLLTRFNLPIEEVAHRSEVHCRRFHFRTREQHPEFVRPSVARAVRRFGLEAFPRPNLTESGAPAGPKAVYISRSRSPRRSMAQELKLERALQGIGFSILHLEDLSMDQHVAALRDAELVVGPHGAGLTHLLWAADGCRVVEILPSSPHDANHCFFSLAHALGFGYMQVPCVADDDNPYGVIPVDLVLEAVRLSMQCDIPSSSEA
jgi:hypothetical protein